MLQVAARLLQTAARSPQAAVPQAAGGSTVDKFPKDNTTAGPRREPVLGMLCGHHGPQAGTGAWPSSAQAVHRQCLIC